MEISKMKNIVVLKNLPSNIVDEAIIILNNSDKAKKLQKIEAKQENNNIYEKEEKNKEQIIKEAEMVISDYISNLEKPKGFNTKSYKNLVIKYKNLRKVTALFAITTIWGAIVSLII